MNKYEKIDNTNLKNKINSLDSMSIDELCPTLISLSEFDDADLVLDVYFEYMKHQDKWVASAAITGIGHLARLNDLKDIDIIQLKLNALLKERPELEGKIDDCLDDLDTFS